MPAQPAAGCFAICQPLAYNAPFYADVAKLVDALDLGSSAARCESSSLSIRTKLQKTVFSNAVFLRPKMFNFTSLSPANKGFHAIPIFHQCSMVFNKSLLN